MSHTFYDTFRSAMGVLLAALFFVVGNQGAAHGKAASCPVNASVAPFPQLSFGVYTVRIIDGAAGDMDGAANGSCTFSLRGCIGGGQGRPEACPGEILSSIGVTVRGGPSREVKEKLTAEFLNAVARETDGIINVSGFKGAATFPVPRLLDDVCFDTTVKLPTKDQGHGWRIGMRTAIRLAPPSRPPIRRQTVFLECVSPSAEEGEARCTEYGRSCLRSQSEPGTPVPGVPTPQPTIPPGNGTTYYLSPAGSDSNGGTSASSPWKTFARVFNNSRVLRPGDTLILLDGTYRMGTTGLPTINCAITGGNANNGTSAMPITIRAQNERRAFLSSDGSHAGLDMFNCAWWRVEGLRAENADNAGGKQPDGFPFRFSNVSNLTVRRLLAARNNRALNTNLFNVEDSSNVLLEECEGYFFHRHAFSIWKSRFVTLRRCYANSMLYGLKGCCSAIDNHDYGDEAISLYGSSDSLVENCVSENHANGFQIHGIENPLDPSGSGGRRNRIFGSISLNDDVAALAASRPKSLGARADFHNARDTDIRDLLVVGGNANQIFGRQVANLNVQNATLIGSGAGGLVVDSSGGWNCHSDNYRCSGSGATCTTHAECGTSCSPVDGGGCCIRNPDGCSFTATNLLTFGHAGVGVQVQSQKQSWLIDSTNSAANNASYAVLAGFGGYVSNELSSPGLMTDTSGNLRRAMQIVPSGMGTGSGQCIAWVPSGSNMKGLGKGGADLGATILYRYENGVLTSQRLWDRATGSFPCGAVVAGVNDGPIRCGNVHARLNVNTNGCNFPAGY